MTNNAAPETKDEKYEPQHLKKWSPPDHWFGEEWWGWYVFIGHHRDSEGIDESNWDCILKDIGGTRALPKSVRVC